MKEIPLSMGQVAIVDDGDYKFLMQWKWSAAWLRKTRTFYAFRHESRNGRRIHVSMHRQIMGLDHGDKRKVDHRNHNTLDNQRSNLRVCTNAQNLWNMQKIARNTSGYTGVHWDKDRRKWYVQFRAGEKRYFLGRFDSLEAAVAVYKTRAAEVRGEFNYQEVA